VAGAGAGFALGTMNGALYESFARTPLGV